MNAGVLGEENSLESIALKGFEIPENGLRVSTGHIELEPSTTQENTLHSINISRSGAKKQKVFKLLHCLVAVGRCFCVEALEGEVLIPDDYDSIYITPGDEDSHYSHQYVVFDSNRVFADYVLFAEYDPEGDEKLRYNTQQTTPDFFKSNEKIISDAYNRAKLSIEKQALDMSESDVSEESQILLLQGQLKTIEQQRFDVTRNAEEMETYLRELFKTALVNLHDITQLKMSALLSAEAEMRRRVEELEWMNQFITYQKEMVAPVPFLDSFQHHNLTKREKIKEISDVTQKSQQVLSTVLPDITAKGELEVRSTTQNLAVQFRAVRLENIQSTENEEDEEGKGYLIDDGRVLQHDSQECIVS